MAQFKRVDKAPENLKENECVINKPDFQEMIGTTRKRRGVSGLTKANSLRDIFMAITDVYAPDINPYRLKLSKYEGLAYETDDDLRKIVLKIIKDNDLPLFEKALEHSINNRPDNTELIYYVSPGLEGNAAFIRLGINQAGSTKKVKVKE